VNLSNVRAWIFDMDGLLVDSERLARAALIQTAGSFEVAPDPEIFTRMIGLPEDASVDLLRFRYGLDFPAEKYIREAARACEVMVASGHLKLKRGAKELLEFLERSGIPKALATSSSRQKAMRTLAAVQMVRRFDVIVTRTDVLRGKPYPDLFLRAARELGWPGDQCIALEDSYNGVRAARAAGIRVIMVPDLLCATPEMTLLSEAIMPDLFTVLDALPRSGLELRDTRNSSQPTER
jgi:HAD superfamily hydrolase (TIGR01509 family)